MSSHITVPEEETLNGQVAQLAAEWREVGSDSSFLRMLSYRSELVLPFFDFYQQLRDDGIPHHQAMSIVHSEMGTEGIRPAPDLPSLKKGT